MKGLKLTALSLIFALAIAGCVSPSQVRPVEVKPAQLPPAPADVMVERQPNFLERLLSFLSASPQKPTK